MLTKHLPALAVKDTQTDIVFVLGAQNPHASRDFDIMKQITQEMLKQPRIGDTRYGFATYSDRGETRHTPGIPKQILQMLLELVPWQKEGTRVDLGVEKGIEIFNQPARPNAERIMVVFSNDKAISSDKDLEDVREKANDAGVKVVVVGIGSRVDPEQIRRLVPDDEDVILVDVEGDQDNVNRKGKETADVVTEVSKRGMLCCYTKQPKLSILSIFFYLPIFSTEFEKVLIYESNRFSGFPYILVLFA